MTNTKNTKRALLSSVMALFLCFTICGDNWDSGLGNGSKVICTAPDGTVTTYILNETEKEGTIIQITKTDHTWEDWKEQ